MAKTRKNNTKEEPIEKQLWKSADKLRENIDAAELNANSVQPGLNQTSMKSFEVRIPDSGAIKMFAQEAKPLIDKIFFNGKQIRALEKLRDTLLPKLMTGEVRVEGVA